MIPREAYQAIFELAGDAIIVIDEKGKILASNEEAVRLFGYSHDELDGQDLSILLPEEIRARHTEMMLQFARGSATRRLMSERPELAGRTKSGQLVPVEITISKISSPEGTFAFAIVRDVSERRGAQQKLEETVKALNITLRRYEEVDRLKDQFLGMAAHDLRNPLSRIGFAIDLIADDEHLKPEGVNLAEIIRRAVTGMTQLINDLLDVNRIQQGKIVLKCKETSVCKFVKEQVQLAQLAADKKSIEIALDLPSVDLRASFDAPRLQQVLENLLSNAVKFSSPGHTVRVKATDEGDSWRLSVTDDGPGLSTADQQRLYLPFSQLSSKPTGGESSTGLGLAITKRIVELHAGTLEVTSALGKGSCFYFLLPKDPERMNSTC